jgi:excisionase family DNA binding protein
MKRKKLRTPPTESEGQMLALPYSIPAFAKVLGVRPSTVRKKLARREVSYFKVGRKVSIPASEATRLIAANMIPALPPERR